jgi:hypothetical protein
MGDANKGSLGKRGNHPRKLKISLKNISLKIFYLEQEENSQYAVYCEL